MTDNCEHTILFEKFKIQACLKKDSISAVYIARHIFLEKDILLKVLNTDNLSDSSLLTRFKREAKILAQIDHPNIIKVFDFGSYKNHFYISFEYFKSQNLRYWLKNKKLTTKQKRHLIQQIVEALTFVHNQGIVHRDLKPENILIDEQLNLKIADFGLALIQNESRITEAQSVVGTPAYMSPEQIRGETLTAASDQFNLGIIIFEMFTGQNPFLGKDAGQTINNILTLPISQIEKEARHLPDDIRTITLRLLQKSPEERFKKTEQLKDYFSSISVPLAPKINRQQKTKWLLAISSGIFLVLLLIVIFKLYKTQQMAASSVPKTVESSSSILHGENGENSLPVTPNGSKKPFTPLSNVQPTVKNTPVVKSNNIDKKTSNNNVNLVLNKKSPAVSLKPGHLILECFPWAEVVIDSQIHFTTPMTQPLSLAPGKHTLQLKHPAFPSYQRTFFLDSGETKTIRIKLDTLFAYVNCQVHPWGKIYINQQLMEQTPLKKPLVLLPGKYVLTIKNERFPEYCDTLIIQKGDTVNLKVNLAQHARVQF